MNVRTGLTATIVLVLVLWPMAMLAGQRPSGETDPNATRLFFGPTGRTIGRGQVYVGVFEIVIPFVQVGITDRISIGGGTPLLLVFNDHFDRPFWVTPKVQVVRREKAKVSVGLLQVFDTEGRGGGLAYAAGTFGRPDTSLTVGAGVTYAGFDTGSGLVMIGGERQISRRVKLLTENYIWTGGNGIGSGGVRFFGEHLSADIGIGFPLRTRRLEVFPVLNVVYLF